MNSADVTTLRYPSKKGKQELSDADALTLALADARALARADTYALKESAKKEKA